MARNTKAKDPRQLPVQLNISVPWAFREFLSDKADQERMSLNKMCLETLRDRFGKEYERHETELARRATREVGATA